MCRLAHWPAHSLVLVPTIIVFVVLVSVMPATGQGTVEILTLRDKPQPVATGKGHVLAGEKIVLANSEP